MAFVNVVLEWRPDMMCWGFWSPGIWHCFVGSRSFSSREDDRTTFILNLGKLSRDTASRSVGRRSLWGVHTVLQSVSTKPDGIWCDYWPYQGIFRRVRKISKSGY